PARGAHAAADPAAATARRPGPGRRLPHHAADGPGAVRRVLLPDPVPGGGGRLPPAARRGGVPAADHDDLRLLPGGAGAGHPARFLRAGPVLLVLAAVWLTRLSPHAGYLGGLLGPTLLLGLAAGCTIMPVTTVVMSRVAPADSGAASGLLQTMQQTGATLGLAVLVTIFGAATGHAPRPSGALLTHGIDRVFTVGIVIAL